MLLTTPLDAMSVGVLLAVALTGTAAHPQPGHTAAEAQGVDYAGYFCLLAAIAIGGYLLSLVLHPNAKCGRCKGLGKHRGAVYTYATRPCTACKGRGTNPRLGRRLLPLFRQPT